MVPDEDGRVSASLSAGPVLPLQLVTSLFSDLRAVDTPAFQPAARVGAVLIYILDLSSSSTLSIPGYLSLSLFFLPIPSDTHGCSWLYTRGIISGRA